MVDNVISELGNLISLGELKRADIQVSRLLRADNIEKAAITELTLHKAQIRLLMSRYDDTIAQVHSLVKDLGDNITPDVKLRTEELLADAYLGRYESAQLGFAIRDDFLLAKQLYESIIEGHPEYHNIGWIYYQRGRIELTQGLIEDAEHSFRTAMFSASDIASLTAYCFERLAFVAYYERRDRRRADILISKALQTYPSGAEQAWMVRALLLRSRIQSKISLLQAEETALYALSIAQQVKSQSLVSDTMIIGDALFAIAEIYSESSQRHHDVIKYLHEFFHTLKAPPGVDVTWSRAYEMLGEAYLNTGQYELSIKAFESSLRYNPDHPWMESIYFRVSKAKYQLNDIEGASDTLTELQIQLKQEQQSISDYRIYLLLADICRKDNRFDEAIDFAHRAIDMAPLDVVGTIRNQYL